MKAFLIKISIFTLLMLAFVAYIIFSVDGYTSPYYKRFTTPKQSNLIIGTSRSAQGIVPEELKKKLDRTFFNYSFTVGESPYGPAYYHSITRKLDESKRGTFIVAVDAWSVCTLSPNQKDSASLWENKRFVARTEEVNKYPNLEFIRESLNKKFYEVLFQRDTRMFLHDDGWLEVNVPRDSAVQADGLARNLIVYQGFANDKKVGFSDLRFNYLKKTIIYLSQFGDVYLVRLPVHPQMFELEEQKVPDFNERIATLSEHYVDYLDLTYLNTEQEYNDGNHMQKVSGRKVSSLIGEWIHSVENQAAPADSIQTIE